MGKKKANVAAEEESGEMDMSPMIDMVFLLLIFFVVNATAITVKKDKNIQMPTASSSGEVKSANGCIVVNVYGEGEGKRPPGVDPSVRWASDVSTPLNSPDELKEYIKNLAERFKDKPDFETRLYLRGDQKALFKGSREVIRVAAECGVVPPRTPLQTRLNNHYAPWQDIRNWRWLRMKIPSWIFPPSSTCASFC